MGFSVGYSLGLSVGATVEASVALVGASVDSLPAQPLKKAAESIRSAKRTGTNLFVCSLFMFSSIFHMTGKPVHLRCGGHIYNISDYSEKGHAVNDL